MGSTCTWAHKQPHTRSKLVTWFCFLAPQLFWPCPPLCLPFSAVPVPLHFSLLLPAVVSCVLWVSDVLFGGFRQVSGSGPAASGPLLYPGQLVAAVSYGRNHLHPAGSPGQLHLVLWGTRRRGTAGEWTNCSSFWLDNEAFCSVMCLFLRLHCLVQSKSVIFNVDW